MSWDTAVLELRTNLNDGPTDKIRAFKKVFGNVDGNNTVFKTFEYRRVTDFKTVAASGFIGVQVDSTTVPGSLIQVDDPETGYFRLAQAPSPPSVVEASYYVQFFNDDELSSFLNQAASFMSMADFTTIPTGLQIAALSYGTAQAYQKLASRFAEHMADVYRLEDMPDEKRTEMIASYSKLANSAFSNAIKLRNDFYTRQGEALQPLWGSSLGRQLDTPPNR